MSELEAVLEVGPVSALEALLEAGPVSALEAVLGGQVVGVIASPVDWGSVGSPVVRQHFEAYLGRFLELYLGF